jgi:hypothetical protein
VLIREQESAPLYTLADYDDASLLGEEYEFSSFAYLVDAVRCLGRVLVVNGIDWTQDAAYAHRSFDNADTALMNWDLHLPETKREIISIDGKMDEVLFTAHMAISM